MADVTLVDQSIVYERNFSLQCIASMQVWRRASYSFRTRYRRNGGSWIYNSSGYLWLWPGQIKTRSFTLNLQVFNTDYEVQFGCYVGGTYYWFASLFPSTTIPEVILHPVTNKTGTTANLKGTVIQDDWGRLQHNLYCYKKSNPAQAYSRTSIVLTNHAGTYDYDFNLINLTPGETYRYYFRVFYSGSEARTETRSFYTGTRTYWFRAFGVKPDLTDVYGELKYFDI